MVLVDVFVEMPQFCSSRVLESTRNVSVWHNQNYHTVSVGIACQARVFADIRDQPNYNKFTLYVWQNGEHIFAIYD